MSEVFNPQNSITVLTTYSILRTDEEVKCNATGGAFTVTLPSISGMAAANLMAKAYRIEKTDSGANAVTIAAATGDTIKLAATIALSFQYQAVILEFDLGAKNWTVKYEDAASVGASGEAIGFFGAVPVLQQSKLADIVTTMGTTESPAGFADTTVLYAFTQAVAAMQTALKNLGLIA